MSRVVSDVTDALVVRKDQYIKCKRPTEEQKKVDTHAFYDKARFSKYNRLYKRDTCSYSSTFICEQERLQPYQCPL